MDQLCRKTLKPNMASWPEIFFARHGETDWNREQRYQGRRDIELNELGRRQADAIGPLLRQMLAEENIDPTAIGWYVSPLGRTVETMTRMRSAFEVKLPPVVVDERLLEISFGVLEGKLHLELPPDLAVPPGKRQGNYWFHRPPQGESYLDVAKRLMPFVDELAGPSVIVAHGGIMRVFRHLLENIPRKEAVNWFPPQGSVARFADNQMDMRYAKL